ncbi:MAG: alpha/beta fold hydrolase, partial [Ignavibacteriaceae bacterium]
MKNFTYKLFFVTLIILLPFFIQAQPVQKFAQLGDFKLENGKVIKNCIIGYHICGRLNSKHTNVILFPTWFGGSSKDLLNLTGPGMMADSTKYFVVTIDALGNGISSSPENSKLQPNGYFPLFNIRDMVKSEYILATKVLGLKHVFCIMGSSMGGMQAFQWIISHPDFMDKAVIGVGSPKLTSNDLLLWNSELLAIQEGLKCNASEESIKNTVTAIHALNLYTPAYYVDHVSTREFPKYLKDT